MSPVLKFASWTALALTGSALLVFAQPGYAFNNADAAVAAASTATAATATAATAGAEASADMPQPIVLTPDAAPTAPTAPEPEPAVPPVADTAPSAPRSLAELVAATPVPNEIDAELHCLAGAIYFEARSESLAGQLAVAEVVVNRMRSPRFPSSICGVVFQKSQFSFVRGGKMPAINTAGRQWANALRIARIARTDGWASAAPGALFFHARRVAPGWRLTRVAVVENHIFYR